MKPSPSYRVERPRSKVQTAITALVISLIPLVYLGFLCATFVIHDLQGQVRTLSRQLDEQKEIVNAGIPQEAQPDTEAYTIFTEKGTKHEGLEALLRAAESGHTEAQFELALLYREGRFFEKDLNAALRLFEAAAANGHTKAILEAGDMRYVQGDFRDAWKWYAQAEKLGEAAAMLRMSMMYAKGQYVPKCKECAEQKRLSAKAAGLIEKEMQAAAVDTKKQDVATAVLQDEDLYRMAAESGNVQSQIAYAGMLLTGDMVRKDVEKALYWYEKAAESGSAVAAESIAAVYEHGIGGVRKSDEKSFFWYGRAAELGSVGALYRCGIMLLKDKKDKEALSYFEKSASQGHAPSLYYVGRLYENGSGISKNEKKFMEAYLASAKKGNKDAMRSLIRIYEKQNNQTEVKRWKKELRAA